MRNPAGAAAPARPSPARRRRARAGRPPRRPRRPRLAAATRGRLRLVPSCSAGSLLFYVVRAPSCPTPRELFGRERAGDHVTVLAADGSVLARARHAAARRFVELDEISPWLVKAVVATEDRALLPPFRHRPDRASAAPCSTTCAPAASSRAAARSPSSWPRTSTSRRERTLRRKLQELVLAIWLETQLEQGPDPHPLPQPGLSRRRRLRRRGGRRSATSASRPRT